MKTFEKYLFLVTFILAFLGIIGLITKIISLLILLSACIYLFIGWKLLSPLKEFKFQWVPFFVSYLIAETIVVVLFGINNYPLKNELSYFTAALLLVATISLWIFNKTLKINYPVNRYLARLLICIMFSIAPIWMEVIQKA